jgi:O-Antigen ligase
VVIVHPVVIDDEDVLDESDWYLALAVVLVPLAAVVAVDPEGWFPFAQAKWAAVSVTSLVAVAAALFARGTHGRAGIDRRSIGLLGALVAVVVVSAITGVAGRTAWFGDPIRHLGVLTWVLTFALFIVGQRTGRRRSTIVAVAHGVELVGLVLGVYVAVEVVFGPPVDWATTSSRLGGSFGSAAYLGAAASLLLPVAIAGAVDRERTGATRWIARLAAVLLVVGLVGSGSRAALLGTVVAGVVWSLASWSSLRRSELTPKVVRTGVFAAGLGLSAVVFAVRAGVFERSAGLSSRLDEWRLALRVVGDHPLIGVGPEGYRFVVDGAIDADYVRKYGEEVGIDRAHSGVLDMALSSGIPAAALYASALGMVVWAAIRVIRRGSTAEVGLAIATIAYPAQQQFLFPIAELEPTFWLFAGIVVIRSRSLLLDTDVRAGQANNTNDAQTDRPDRALHTDAEPDRAADTDRVVETDRAVETDDVDRAIHVDNAILGRSRRRRRSTRSGHNADHRVQTDDGNNLDAVLVTGDRVGAEAVDRSVRATSRVSRSVALGAAVACGVLTVVAGVVGVRAVVADRAARDAVRAATSEESVAAAQRAVDLGPADIRYRLLLAQAQEAQRSLSGVDAAIATVEGALRMWPREPFAEFELARIVSLRAEITGTDDDRERAESAWDALLLARPSCARCRFAAAMASYERGDIATTRRLLAEAASLGDARAQAALDELET